VSFVVPEEVDRYAEAHTTPHSELLARLAAETKASLDCPQMLTGPVEGRFLQQLVFASGARRVLEFGTYSGYSSLSMVQALPPDGRIDTLELSPQHAEVARRYIDEAGESGRITVHLGPAIESLAQLDGPFDLVFIDADKTGYDAYYEAVLPKLSERGLIVLDNMLQGGRVVSDPDADESTRAIHALNEKIVNDPRVVAVLLTVRDGVTLVRRAT
jgi:caffeoyl-CoA O-methyltransferase